MSKVKVNNIPKNIEKYNFIVACLFNDQYYFWGAFYKKEDAIKAAREERGIVLEIHDLTY